MRAKTSRVTNPWAAIDAIVNANPEPTGAEWFTAMEYSERYGGGYTNNQRKLRRDPRFESWKGVSGKARQTITKFRLKEKA